MVPANNSRVATGDVLDESSYKRELCCLEIYDLDNEPE
jgi:hypothetical protein